MSLSIINVVNLKQHTLKSIVGEKGENDSLFGIENLGGIFGNNSYAWLANGPRLDVFNTKTGNKIGTRTFGGFQQDQDAEIVCVEEIAPSQGCLPILAVGVNYYFSGGVICICDLSKSRIIRSIAIPGKISCLHVIDSGCDIFTLPGPLRSFDGILTVGTSGGDVFVVDICRQTCEEALTFESRGGIRNESNPCQVSNIVVEDIKRMESLKEAAERNSQHLIIHLNELTDKSKKHFVLKGPKGEERLHVNKAEVVVSALHYCPQLGSILVGFNFGAFQLYNLMTLELVYTSPVCEEHIPISYFTIQEPADDPRANCYIWAVYSSQEELPTSLPIAVMYTFCYQTKEYHEGYGVLYQEFSAASVHFQMELGVPINFRRGHQKFLGGSCIKLSSISKGPLNREGPQYDSNEDNLALCLMGWNVYYKNGHKDTFLTVFDLNQWYNEQMPRTFDIRNNPSYIVQIQLNDLINSSTNNTGTILSVQTDDNSFQMFKQTQRLEEHFCPNSMTFSLYCLRETDVVHLRNYGVQKTILAQIESGGSACLVEPSDMYKKIIDLGLSPLFSELARNIPITTIQQRDVILSAALENHLMGWLCKCASEWSNGSYFSIGCSLNSILTWAFQRTTVLKNNCDKICISMFDYSGRRLDMNSLNLFNCCTRQLNNLVSLYSFIVSKLGSFVPDLDVAENQFRTLDRIVVYFNILQWLMNVGFLPECPEEDYPLGDTLEKIHAPYPVENILKFYNERRIALRSLNESDSMRSLLFIDNLIEREGSIELEKQWRNDGGNGHFPPPSIQALLRTYLVENMDLIYKHSIVVYLFLDITMTLDPDQYKPAITHLMKFPAVFNISLSLTKLIQAFWQLDHGDFNRAMVLLLDPLIAPQDLVFWHHKVVLRSLIHQEQFSLALLYLQVRKPIFNDEEDILLSLSLYVSNTMIDEAVYFMRNRISSDKYLIHFFTECFKHDQLEVLTSKILTHREEKVFLDFLAQSRSTKAQDLLVNYHTSRAQYLEAFEKHDRRQHVCVESRGLLGQANLNSRHQIINAVREILPDLTQNLIKHSRAQKHIKTTKPQPMSSFLSKGQFKSTMIAAALVNAKQTFNVFNDSDEMLRTESIPFLRQSHVFKNAESTPAVVVGVKPEYTPPVKRLKVTNNSEVCTKLQTPLVKRKIRTSMEAVATSETPHSILKVKSLHEESRFNINDTPSRKKRGLGIASRKPLTPSVRFEDSKKLCANLKENSIKEDGSYSGETSIETKKPDAKNYQTNDVSKCSSVELEENDLLNTPKKRKHSKAFIFTPYKLEGDLNDVEKMREEKGEEKVASPVKTPRSRISYRDSVSPSRSSPSSSEIRNLSGHETPSSPSLPKLRPRKSLYRQVLKINTINSINTEEKVQTEEIGVSKLGSSKKYDDGVEIRERISVKKHSVSTRTVNLNVATLESITNTESCKHVSQNGTEALDLATENIQEQTSTNDMPEVSEIENVEDEPLAQLTEKTEEMEVECDVEPKQGANSEEVISREDASMNEENITQSGNIEKEYIDLQPVKESNSHLWNVENDKSLFGANTPDISTVSMVTIFDTPSRVINSTGILAFEENIFEVTDSVIEVPSTTDCGEEVTGLNKLLDTESVIEIDSSSEDENYKPIQIFESFNAVSSSSKSSETAPSPVCEETIEGNGLFQGDFLFSETTNRAISEEESQDGGGPQIYDDLEMDSEIVTITQEDPPASIEESYQSVGLFHGNIILEDSNGTDEGQKKEIEEGTEGFVEQTDRVELQGDDEYSVKNLREDSSIVMEELVYPDLNQIETEGLNNETVSKRIEDPVVEPPQESENIISPEKKESVGKRSSTKQEESVEQKIYASKKEKTVVNSYKSIPSPEKISLETILEVRSKSEETAKTAFTGSPETKKASVKPTRRLRSASQTSQILEHVVEKNDSSTTDRHRYSLDSNRTLEDLGTSRKRLRSASQTVELRQGRNSSEPRESSGQNTRVTRKAKSVIESHKGNASRGKTGLEKALDALDKSIEPAWNPLVLLNKKSFTGPSDPEEQKVYEVSPPSAKPTRRLRSASQILEAVFETNDEVPNTMDSEETRETLGKPTRRPRPAAQVEKPAESSDGNDAVVSKGTGGGKVKESHPKRRLRSASQNSEAANEKGDKQEVALPKPVRRLRSASQNSDVSEPERGTRLRRKKSVDELLEVSVASTKSRKRSEEREIERPNTRARAKSVSPDVSSAKLETARKMKKMPEILEEDENSSAIKKQHRKKGK